MIPTGRVIQAWRFDRRMSQAELAQKSGVARPNLSVIEQGGRDITLSTLRRIALALQVSCGTLADGVLPGALARKPWTREQLDRMARSVAQGGGKFLDKRLQQAAYCLAAILKQKTAGEKFVLPRRGKKAEKAAYLAAHRFFTDIEIQNLLSRIRKWSDTQNDPT